MATTQLTKEDHIRLGKQRLNELKEKDSQAYEALLKRIRDKITDDFVREGILIDEPHS